MLRADRFAEITDTRPGHGETPAAHTSRRAARRTQVISGGRSQWRNRPHGAYRGLVNRRWWLRTRTHFLTRTYWRTSRARCATRAAPLRKSRRLAEFGTQRSGLNKNRSHRFCGTEGWTWSPHPDMNYYHSVGYYWWKTCAIRRKTFHHQKDVAQGSDLG